MKVYETRTFKSATKETVQTIHIHRKVQTVTENTKLNTRTAHSENKRHVYDKSKSIG